MTNSQYQRGFDTSVWAAVTPPGENFPQLDATCDTDVVIIGAGFTGLSTALHLRQQHVDTIVLEAAEPGWGASGRNNGQVIPTLSRPDPDAIERHYGAVGERFVLMLRDCASLLFDIVREHELDVEAEQTGWIQPAHSPGRMKMVQQRYQQWQARGADVACLDAAAIERMTGSRQWYGGFWNRSGGHINPLRLARALARRVQQLGAQIYTHSPATRYTHKNGRWIVATPQGAVRAKALVLATNAYGDAFSHVLAPRVVNQVIPAVSWQMATAPLSDAVRQQILPGRQAMSDTHSELYFARYDARNRLVTGGNLIFSYKGRERLQRMIGQRLQHLWPVMGEVTFDYVWNGFVGMTRDFYPRFHQLGPQALAWTGCNGRGVGLSVAIGREFARALTGTASDDLALPFSTPEPLPARNTVRLVAPLALWRYRRLDRREIAQD